MLDIKRYWGTGPYSYPFFFSFKLDWETACIFSGTINLNECID